MYNSSPRGNALPHTLQWGVASRWSMCMTGKGLASYPRLSGRKAWYPAVSSFERAGYEARKGHVEGALMYLLASVQPHKPDCAETPESS